MRPQLLLLALVAACKFDPLPSLGGIDAPGGGDGGGIDACMGIGCNVITCDPGDETTIRGRVLLPNGITPMAGVDVYVPTTTPGPITHGATCDQCGPFPGGSAARGVSGADGSFSILNAPPGDNIPVIVSIGKWRRSFTIPHLDACSQIMLPDTQTRLPRNRSEGDLPRIAITTGAADAIECVVRKIGIDDSEFTTSTGTGSIHMYAPNGSSGANRFVAGTMFPDASALWNQVATLSNYDALILGCEGSQQPANKPQQAMGAMRDYANAGGRIFATHFQNIWIGGEAMNPAHGVPEWESLAMFNINGSSPTGNTLIDQSTPGGTAFAAYQLAVTAAPVGVIPMAPGTQRNSVMNVDATKVRRLATTDPASGMFPTNFDFTTPVTAAPNQRCGRVAFSDMHQGTGSTSTPSTPFPQGCTASPLSPQDIALVYLIFDLQRCVPPQ